jgi:uncharacterized paraquat-inducible protein A
VAEVRLGRFEVEEGKLPFYCMRCGEPASIRRRKRFSWCPQWVLVLVVFFTLPGIIVALILTKRMIVLAPLCANHRNHWRWRAHLVGWRLAGWEKTVQ